MLPRSQSDNFANGRPKKKPAPPRPPQPSHLKLQNTQSFRTSSGTKSFQRSMSIGTASNRPNAGNDLIDFSTPPSSPPKSASFIQNRSNEFMYRVGASIFYIKSPLKNSTSETPSAHPFSPPRPSAQSLLSTPIKSSNAPAEGYQRNTTNTGGTQSSTKPTPTIIRLQGGSTSSSNSSNYGGNNTANQSNNNTWKANSQQSEPTRYGNVPHVPVAWDEPPKKFPPVIAPKPTIIRPSPTSTITSTQSTTQSTTTSTPGYDRNYYDEPPEFDQYDQDEFDAGDSFASPPMPNEPPPPPPPDLEADEWSEEATNPEVTDEQYADAYMTATEGDRAYAIALYDFTPETEGDLALQAGDLVYLTKVIDDSWLYGICGGVEGIFPSNYVNIQVPLPSEDLPLEDEVQVPEINSTETEPVPQENNQKFHYADVLYQFKAETENDLNLEPGDVVTIWGRINEDWLYGTINRQYGQFPASFVSSVPADLPTIEL